jgi:chaperone BCS1
MVVANDEEIPLTPLIKAKVKAGATAEEGTQIVVYSTRLPISQLRNWLDDLYERYIYERSNRLGNKTYYFNEIPTEPPKELDPVTKAERYRMADAPRHLNFTMNEFRTSKSFANVYGSHVDDLKERLDLFTNHPEWYMERGIPHSLGVLLHGLPGAGKTSTIKAIAADTNRHIFNLSLRAFTTQKQLDQLFYNEMVYIQDEGIMHIYRIPINRRVYVIEDIDCLTDVVRDREFFPREEPKDNRITLSYLLNLLDGVLETPGRILIITTNFPENLDRALVRPGRIDVRIEFGHADRALIAEMVGRFYETTVSVSDIPAALDGTLTPAEVMECLCTYFRDRAAAMVALEKKAAAPRAVVAPKPAMTVEDAISLSVSPPKILVEEVAPKLMISEVTTIPAPALENITVAANHLQYQPNRYDASELKIFGSGGSIAPATLAPPDPGIFALFKRFEHATTPEEFEMAHKLANTFDDLQAFDPDAA